MWEHFNIEEHKIYESEKVWKCDNMNLFGEYNSLFQFTFIKIGILPIHSSPFMCLLFLLICLCQCWSIKLLQSLKNWLSQRWDKLPKIENLFRIICLPTLWGLNEYIKWRSIVLAKDPLMSCSALSRPVKKIKLMKEFWSS